MAAIPVTLDGVVYDLYNRTQARVIFFGDASLTGLGIGGGPIIPPVGEKPPQPPLGIWGPPGPWVSPPIANVPGLPPMPDQPPPDQTQPPPGTVTKPPPPEGGWGYSPEYGWGYYPKPGEPGPKK